MASLRSQRALTEQTNENIMQQSRQLRNKAAAGMEKAITTRQRTALGEIGNNKSQNILGKNYCDKQIMQAILHPERGTYLSLKLNYV